MPAAELAVWLVPGYLVLLLYLHINPLRSKQSYEWFFQAAGFGILAYAVALALALGWRYSLGLLPAWSPQFGDHAVRAWWTPHSPFTNSGLWLIAVFTSPLVATIACWGRKLFLAAQFLSKRLSPKSRPSDIFLFRCLQLEKQLAILNIDSGKVYVGFVTDFTSDPDEADRYIEILPIMSGHRNPDTRHVEFTTPYFAPNNEEPDEAKLEKLANRRAILIPATKITTLARFDVELHEWSIKQGLVKVTFNFDGGDK